jgi:exodeoxyribonuclease VII large subunit
LKDKSGTGVLDCIIWKSNYILCGVRIEEGMEVILSGYPDVYPATGRFSFKAETIELKGEGVLKKAYEELKKRLEEEGIFEESAKRLLPKYPQRIGVITSKQGAVIADFLNNLGNFGFKIKMIDSRVEGQQAAKDLMDAIRSFKKQDVEVLVVMRGGGSLESLMAFNNEMLVREVRNFPVPVIAAIGHDRDVPLMSLAADAMCSTPTAAATLLGESWKEAQYMVERLERNIMDLYGKRLAKISSFLSEFAYIAKEKFGMIISGYKEAENKLKMFLVEIRHVLDSKKEELENYSKFIGKGFVLKAEEIRLFLKNSEKLIISYNPERQLKLGYSIARRNGMVIKSAKSVKIGEDLDVQVSDGEIKSKVEKIINKQNYA